MAVVTGQAVVFKGNNGLGILLGSGPPDSSVGVDGQPGYLDQTNNLLYGPKVSGAWPSVGYQFGGNLLMYAGKPPDSFGRLGNLSLDISQGFIYGPKTSSSWPAQPLLVLVGPQGVKGDKGDTGAAGVSPTLPNDYTANSFVVTPVSGDTNPVQIALLNSSGTVLFKVDASGNVTIAGGVTVTGAATVGNLILASGGKVTFPDGTTQNTATVSSGGGSSSGTTASLDTVYMGLHQANGNYPTAYTANNGYMVNTQWVSNSSVLATGSAYVSPYAGTINSIQCFAVAGLSGGASISVCLYKNGVATSLVATTTTGNSFYANATSTISVAAGDTFQLFVKGSAASISNSLIGWCTFAPSISATAQATGSRAIISGGSYYNTSTNTSYWTTVVPKINNNGNTAIGSTEYFFKAPFPFTLTGWTLNQYVNNGSNTFQVCKNRTSSTLNNILTTTAGNATVSGFPGNQFSGTYTKGTYNFAAGDVLSVVVAFGSGTSTNMDIQFAIEWT